MEKNSDRRTDFGIYDEKGHWRPPYPCAFSPLFERPIKMRAVLKYIFGWGGYLWPRNALYAGLAVFTWFFLQAGLETTSQLGAQWIGFMLLRNIALMWFISGTQHLLLYTFKVQGNERKYNPQWQEKNSKKFLFNNQVADNIFMCTVSGGLIWTAYEVFYVWAASTRLAPLFAWADNPVWFVVFFLVIPIYRESHFYFIHRLIHWKPLLRSVHYIHHKNPNPGPWSGLSMHPVEHLLYFSVVLIHFVVPSHPIHFFYNSQLTALTPAGGHDGFEGPLLKGIFPIGDYFHYLHHRFVSCNFGTSTVPWDRWLGRFYNGEGTYRTKKW
jgi:sterol desaturase/sphingolipid hydroxylase (fatty acid hydroxylase superfamily)